MSEQLAATPRYTKLHIATHASVLDERAGLEWAVNCPAVHGKKLTHAEAKEAIAKLNAENYLGRSNWRLPTPHEQFGLVGYTYGKKTYDADAFPDMRTDGWYWTDQELPTDSSYVFAVYFGGGCVDYLLRDDGAFCRPVASVPVRQ